MTQTEEAAKSIAFRRDQKDALRRAVDALPLASRERELAMRGIDRMAPAEVDVILKDYDRLSELLPRILGREYAGSQTSVAPVRKPSPLIERGSNPPRTLIVGRDIALRGEITSCDRLVVEGNVEANLANCREIDIAERGLFKGSASIEEAEIRGRFEGTLTVRKRLFIRATGVVVGTIRYGQIEIERGGRFSGDIQTLSDAATNADVFEERVGWSA